MVTYNHIRALYDLWYNNSFTLDICWQVLAILAFSLTAGFSVENQFNCDIDVDGTIENFTITLKSSYPYREYDFSSSEDGNKQIDRGQDLDRHYSSGAEFFVAWGVLSMIYCLVAIPMYMLLTANEDLERLNSILILCVSLCSVLC